MRPSNYSRRGFLGGALAALKLARAQRNGVPVGILVYAVLADWNADREGTLAALAHMGYEGVELTQYESWTPSVAARIHKAADGLHLRVFATHTEPEFLAPGDKQKKVIELNQILGTQTVCCVRGLAENASGAGYRAATGSDGWKELAAVLQSACEALRPFGMRCSFHNHGVEFRGSRGDRPIDVLAQAKDLKFHIDVNVARRAGANLPEFVRDYPKRLDSLLLTDGPADASRHAPLFGKGDTPWKEILSAAEDIGGVRFYLLNPGRAEWPPLETAKRDLDQYKLVRSQLLA